MSVTTSGTSAPDFTEDEFWGKGGNYVVDSVTGKRVPAPADADSASGAESTVSDSFSSDAEKGDASPSKSEKPTVKETRRG